MNMSGETKTGAPVIEPEAVSNASFRRTIVAVPSDTQCGSVYGLMPTGEWSLAEGGSYIPNELQDLIWKQWVECWGVVRALRDEVPNTRLIVAHNGDAVEGFHHGTTEIISLSVGEHERIHLASMDSALEIAGYDGDAGDLLYYVAGTTAHVGAGAESEDTIARQLGAVPSKPPGNDRDGRYVWEKLRLRVNGALFDIAHQGPVTGSRAWLTGNILRLTLRSIYYDCLENGLEIPRCWVRSHRHRWIPPELFRGANGEIEGFMTPCFQAMTGYVHQRFSYELLSHIGMLIFVVEEDGRVSWQCPRVKVVQDDVVNV